MNADGQPDLVVGCNGAIVGRALYENRFTLPEAIAAAA